MTLSLALGVAAALAAALLYSVGAALQALRRRVGSPARGRELGSKPPLTIVTLAASLAAVITGATSLIGTSAASAPLATGARGGGRE